MSQVVFENKGVIDPRSITTFGVNSKESTSAIGHFGTGLKYAIAVLLRENHHIRIMSGGESYEFTTKRERIRLNDFDIVYMNDQPLGFTTELGKQWEIWMAYRELYCNTLDEKGRVYTSPDNAEHDIADSTVVVVQGKAFEEMHVNREKYFPDFSKYTDLGHGNVQIADFNTEFLFYKGIRVFTPQARPLFGYNVTGGQSLTEDRTLSSTWTYSWAVAKAVGQLKDRGTLGRILLAPSGTFEAQLDGFGAVGPDFVTFVRENKHHERMNPAALNAVKSVLGNEFYDSTECVLTPREERIMGKALKLVEKVCSPIKYPICVTEDLPPNKMAIAVFPTSTIWLNRSVIAMGSRRVASTLYEENLHLLHKLADCSREMQNHLLDTLFGFVADIG